MEPITILVTALAVGAAAGLRPTAEQAVKDAYEGLKALLYRKCGDLDFSSLERRPDSQAKRASVAEDLEQAGAAKDAEVVKAAQSLLTLIERKCPEAATDAGVTIEQVHAAGSINIDGVIARGGAIRIIGLQAGQDINIRKAVSDAAEGIRGEGKSETAEGDLPNSQGQ